MQNDELLIQQVLDLNVQELETAEACAEQLKLAAGEANKMAAAAVGYGQMAIRYAIKAGEIMHRAKELLAHGEFTPWLENHLPSVEISLPTATRWMKLAKSSIVMNLMDNPDIKTITDAYRATGILPEPEPKPEGEGDKEKPPFSLSFRTVYRLPSEWNRDAAKDFLYEFDRLARLAVQLKTEFGL
jgi:hypothetical protein